MSKETNLYPGFFKRSYAAVSLFTASALAACTGGGIPPKEGNTPSPEKNQTIEQLLDLPFPPDQNMKIQQGWFYGDGRLHAGIDYIKGQLDNSSTWQSFPVLTVADGQACLNPPRREGNAVFIEHVLNGITLRSFYGHLKDGSSSNIPDCISKDRKPVKKGEKVGEAGSTGVKDEKGILQPTWTHIHFQINDNNGRPIDPYRLGLKRDTYPDPNFTNGKECGKDALFAKCYEQKGAVVAAPGQTQITQTDRITATTVAPTRRPEPTATKEAVPALDQQAQILSTRFWMQDLDNPIPRAISQRYFDYLATTKVNNISPLNNKPFTAEDIVSKRIQPGDDLIQLSWEMTRSRSYWSGEIEVKRLNATSSSSSLSVVDRENRIGWKGNVKLNFIFRFRGNYSQTKLPTLPSPTQPWSPWRDDSRSYAVSLVNNQWEITRVVAPYPVYIQIFYPDCKECPVSLNIP